MAKTLKDTPWPVLLLVLSFLCPTELSVYVGGARLPPHRTLLLVLVPLAAIALLGKSPARPRVFDLGFLGFSIWTVAVYIYHHGPSDGLQTGGALALDSFGSYMVARAYVRDDRSLTATATTLLLAVFVAGAIALPETLLGRIFVHDFLREATGYVHPVGIETRLGLTRAFGVFDHPIHLGTFCAGNLALVIYAAKRDLGAGMRAFVIAGSALTSMSSAPMLSLAAQLSLIAFETLTRRIRGRVTLAVGGLVVLFAAVSLVATRSPFAIIATGFTLDPWTGYYRLMIWQHGLENVWHNAWMGIGLNDWERPQWMVSSTVDAFWLVIAMRGGLPAILLLAFGVLAIGCGVARRMRRFDLERRRLATGWMISLLGLSLVGCTVHYWNVPFAYYFFFLGLGGCLADPRRQTSPAAARNRQPPAPRLQWLPPAALPAASTAVSATAQAREMPRWPVPSVARRMLL